ncbi:hypothetical protein ABZO31_04695 [Streptomyces sp. HUAS MG47]|uniref:hypothetical protein n=1 Tax=Streptomyces solicamelliae TaxID=3231716 RepID=UPI003877C73A
MTALPGSKVTAAIAFVRMPKAESAQCRGRPGEEPALSYFRCMASAFGSVRRWNPEVDLVLVTAEPLPEPYAGQLARIGVETVLAPFAHRPPEGLGDGWASSLYHLDAMEALRGRGGTQVFIEPDLLCVRPLDDLLAAVGDRVGAHFEPSLMRPESRRWTPYWEMCEVMHPELGEPTGRHEVFTGSCFVIPEHHVRVLLDRLERAWRLTLDRHRQGLPGFSTDEHFMNYALRGVPVVEISGHTRCVSTVPWLRCPERLEVLPELTLWNLAFEKDRGFQWLYPYASDPASWFWTAPAEEFRARAAALMSVGPRGPGAALVGAAARVLRDILDERLRRRLRSGYGRLLQLRAMADAR